MSENNSNETNELSAKPIRAVQSVVVFGAGTMGSGIASHLANLGFKVTIVAPSVADLEAGFDRCKRMSPPAFFELKTAQGINLLTLEECEAAVRNADWICEAIFENISAKTSLYQQIEGWIADHAFITTNTSGLEIESLALGRSPTFQRKFLGTHFFNPPRYLKLVELIPSKFTDPTILQEMKRLLEANVARRCVLAKDTPGFIANRFGMWVMFNAIHLTAKLGLGIEDVDAITGPFIGRPKSASFRLNDIVGLDVMQDIAKNLLERCPNDPFIQELKTPASMKALLEKGWLGAKNGQGYYRKEGKELLAFDSSTQAYRNLREPAFKTHLELAKLPIGERIRKAIQIRDECGTYLKEHLISSLRYANYLKEEISHSVQDFDRIMEWGFGWKMGPFKLIDEIGPEILGIQSKAFYEGKKMQDFDGKWIAQIDEPEFKPITEYPILESKSKINLRDLGDGISAIGVTSKLGVIDPIVLNEIDEWLQKGLNRFVLTSESSSYSAGFDLKTFQECISLADYESVLNHLLVLQTLGEKLAAKQAVSAIFGYSLGGGLELALSCPMTVAMAEAKIGFPEAKVGLLPGGRGTVMMRMDHQKSAKELAEAAILLAEGKVTENAVEAKNLGILRPSDLIEFHPDRLIHTAKHCLLDTDFNSLYKRSWLTVEGPAAGMIDREISSLKASGSFTAYDGTIAEKIKQVFSKPESYEKAIEKERIEFVELCKNPLTQTRIRFMLENGRPHKN